MTTTITIPSSASSHDLEAINQMERAIERLQNQMLQYVDLEDTDPTKFVFQFMYQDLIALETRLTDLGDGLQTGNTSVVVPAFVAPADVIAP